MMQDSARLKLDDVVWLRKHFTITNKIENSDKKDKNVIMISGNYHEGVLGIVASNIVERYQKPVLIMNYKDGILKGSARSIFDFNIYTAMNKISDLFVAFGGHTLAAGFSFEEKNFDKIEEFLHNEYEEYKQNNELKSRGMREREREREREII